MMATVQDKREVFKQGSKTYFNSSLFFPRTVREEVFILYGFVRVADNYVDAVPQQRDGFFAFLNDYHKARTGRPAGNGIIDEFVDLEKKRGFAPEWTDAFFRSMEMDLSKTTYKTVEETLDYVYGSAEVIGLYMARIMGLDKAADDAAQMLGRAMQFINFIRDIDEDNGLGRTYLPLGESSLPDLTESTARANKSEFLRFIRLQLERYRGWQKKAETGYSFIPHRYLIPIKSASDMYNWTAERIAQDPFIVYRRKVKPGRSRILASVFGNALSARGLSQDGHRG